MTNSLLAERAAWSPRCMCGAGALFLLAHRRQRKCSLYWHSWELFWEIILTLAHILFTEASSGRIASLCDEGGVRTSFGRLLGGETGSAGIGGLFAERCHETKVGISSPQLAIAYARSFALTDKPSKDDSISPSLPACSSTIDLSLTVGDLVSAHAIVRENRYADDRKVWLDHLTETLWQTAVEAAHEYDFDRSKLYSQVYLAIRRRDAIRASADNQFVDSPPPRVLGGSIPTTRLRRATRRSCCCCR